MKKTILIFSIIFVSVMIVFFAFNFILFPKKYNEIVIKYSNKYGLDSALVYSIIKTESGFDKNAVSKAGAKGLMQLLPSTAQWVADKLGEEFNEDMLFNPEKNIKYGCYYLSYLRNKFQDFDIVVCAYNAGETVVREWLDENGKLIEEKISYSETKNYLQKVRLYYKIYS